MTGVPEPTLVRRVCAGCGKAALVPETAVVYHCESCRQRIADSAPAEHPDQRVGRFWQDAAIAGNAGLSGAFAAIDQVFNPAAARAAEQLQGEHERVVSKPSPGDDALRHGRIVIRRPPAGGADGASD